MRLALRGTIETIHPGTDILGCAALYCSHFMLSTSRNWPDAPLQSPLQPRVARGVAGGGSESVEWLRCRGRDRSAVPQCRGHEMRSDALEGPHSIGVGGLGNGPFEMLGAEKTGFVSIGREDLGQMALVRLQVIGEAGVGQTDDAVRVRVASGPESGPRRAALGRDAKAVLELKRRGREGVDVRCTDAENADGSGIPEPGGRGAGPATASGTGRPRRAGRRRKS